MQKEDTYDVLKKPREKEHHWTCICLVTNKQNHRTKHTNKQSLHLWEAKSTQSWRSLIFFPPKIFVYGCLLSCMFVHCMHAWCPQKPKRVTHLPETELQMVASPSICMLGNKLASSGRAAHLLCWDISPASASTILLVSSNALLIELKSFHPSLEKNEQNRFVKGEIKMFKTYNNDPFILQIEIITI